MVEPSPIVGAYVAISMPGADLYSNGPETQHSVRISKNTFARGHHQPPGNCISSPRPSLPVEAAILYRFSEMFRPDIIGSRKVCDCT